MLKVSKRKVAMLFALTLLMTSLVFVQVGSEQIPVDYAYIEPPITYTNISEDFVVTVIVDVSFPIQAFEFNLTFEPTQMSGGGIYVIPPWIQGGGGGGAGWVQVSGFSLTLVPPGKIPLAEITFHCDNPGISKLLFDYILVWDEFVEPHSLPWEGGIVNQNFYWKPLGLIDYAPSGIPDFDQKQDKWANPKTGKWSYCGPTAIANSLWWLDSFYEPSPVPPPTINDNFPLVWSYNPSVWDDHDPLNVGPLIGNLAWYFDTDGQRTGAAHNGTKVMDIARGIDQYLLDHGLSGAFYQKTVPAPDFYYVEKEVEKCEDVTLLLGFWQFDPDDPTGKPWRVGGHYVTVAGIDSEGLQIAFSDPCVDNAEAGRPGIVRPGPHGYPHPSTIHNDTLFVSHDIYAALVPGPGGTPGNPNFEVKYDQSEVDQWFDLINNMTGQNTPDEFEGQTGPYNPALPVFTEVEYAVIVSPWYAKPPQPDYAPSGVPDFDQRQNGIKYVWKNPYPPVGTWSWCGPTAVANSLWWLDSEFEPNPVPPPEINDGFPLVSAYGPWDDHDPQNVPYLIEHLAYLMNTDNLQGTQPPGYERCGTSPIDMQIGIDMYLREKGLDWKFYEHTEPMPDFYWIEDQVEKGEDVILLLGFWQEQPPGSGIWKRMGGHYVTVAGVDSTDMYIALSDPFRDAAEFGGVIPGRVLPLGHGSWDHTGIPETLHNNASYVSHDIYTVGMSPSPGGEWGLVDYYADEEGFIDNFDSCQNFPEEWWEWEGRYDPLYGPVYTEIEYAIITSCETGRVAAGSEDTNVYVHDFYGNLQWQWATGAPVLSVAFDNDARYLASGSRHLPDGPGVLSFFDVNAVTGGGLNPPLWVKNIPISESYDGGWKGTESKSVDVKYNSYNQCDVVAAATDKGLYLYDQWGNLIWQYFDEMPETMVRISQDGNYIICVNYNSGTAHYFSHLRDGNPGWGSLDGVPVWNIFFLAKQFFWAAISGLGDYVALSTRSPAYVILFYPANKSTVWSYMLPKGGYVRVDMPCDGRSVVAVNDDPSDSLGCDLLYFSDGGDGWDSGDGTPVWSFWPGIPNPQNVNHDFYTVAISENGDVIATGGADGVSNIYVLWKDSTLLQTIPNGPTVQSVDLTFTGQYGIAGDDTSTYGFFDKDLGLQWTYTVGGPIHSVAISKIYPCMFPFPDHDVAVIDVTPVKTIVSQGFCTDIHVTVENQGDFTETNINVTVYANDTYIQTLTIPSLAPSAQITLTLKWNTTGWAKGNYTIKATADIVYNEIDVYDNTYVDNTVLVTIPGDVDGSRKVDWKDIYEMILHFMCKTGQPCYVPNDDVTCDGVINMKDIYQAILHFMESW